MTTSFKIHSKLQDDCVYLGRMKLCEVLLMNDNRFPWVILVPRIPGLRDFHELPEDSRPDLFNEIEVVSQTLKKQYKADKINVAALGNQVPQLHVHIIARRQSDEAWPGPVWGSGTIQPYSRDALAEIVQILKHDLALVT